MCEGCVCLGRGLCAPSHTAGPAGGCGDFLPKVTQGSFGWGCFRSWWCFCSVAFWHHGTARCALGAPCGAFGSGCRGPRGLGTGGARGSCLQPSAEQLLLWRVTARALAAFPAPRWGPASRPSVSTKFLLISCPRTHPVLSCSALPPGDVAQPKIREVSKQGTQLITTSLLGAARLTPTDFIRRLNLIAAR